MWEKKGKIRRTRTMTKKRSSEIFTLKMALFPEIGPRKNILVPPKFGARSPPMGMLNESKNLPMQSVAAPARCSWQANVKSLVASGRAVNISIHEQRFMSSDVSNSFYCRPINDVKVQNMLNQKLHCSQSYRSNHLL